VSKRNLVRLLISALPLTSFKSVCTNSKNRYREVPTTTFIPSFGNPLRARRTFQLYIHDVDPLVLQSRLPRSLVTWRDMPSDMQKLGAQKTLPRVPRVKMITWNNNKQSLSRNLENKRLELSSELRRGGLSGYVSDPLHQDFQKSTIKSGFHLSLSQKKIERGSCHRYVRPSEYGEPCTRQSTETNEIRIL
jgi:hypothetical protein